jgi:3-methyladenine DNA glycosylase AlkD
MSNILTEKNIKEDLLKLQNPGKAKNLSRFFKTGKGEYGEGDQFLGITVPEIRLVAKKYPNCSLQSLQALLLSKIHEYRLTALIILVNEYQKAEQAFRREIFDFYLRNTKHINNWDLVDLSSHEIIGNYLLDKDRAILFKLAKSNNLWEKRIAIISTFELIKNNQFQESFKIAEILLNDNHDLIHKAVGWMLREIGKRSLETEDKFLEKYAKIMPRICLRYAIEKFPEEKRKRYLEKQRILIIEID